MASENMKKAIMLLVTTDLTQKQIADKIGVTEDAFTKWKKKDEWHELVKEYNQEFFKELAVPAQKRINHLMMNADSETVQLQAAKEILAQADYVPTQKTENKTTHEFDTLHAASKFRELMEEAKNDDENT